MTRFQQYYFCQATNTCAAGMCKLTTLTTSNHLAHYDIRARKCFVDNVTSCRFRYTFSAHDNN